MLLAAWYHPLLAVLFSFLAVILMIVILLQRGKGVGLAGAFGGAGGHTAFGAKTGDVLTWLTVGLAGGLLLTAIFLNYAFVPFQAPAPAAMSAPGQQAGQPAPAATGGSEQAPAPAESEKPAPAANPAEKPAEGSGDQAAPPAGDKTAPGGGPAPVPFGLDGGFAER